MLCSVGDPQLVFGGAGKDAPLNDTWIFDTASCCWTYPAVTGAIPRMREMHTCAFAPPSLSEVSQASEAAGGKVLVFGGRDNEGRVLQDACVLNVARMEWEKPRRTDFPRCAHACAPVKFRDTLVAGVIGEASGLDQGQAGFVVYGGFSGQGVENSVLFVTEDLGTTLDISGQVSGAAPSPSFAHVGLALEDAEGFTQAMVTFGGISLSEDANALSALQFTAA